MIDGKSRHILLCLGFGLAGLLSPAVSAGVAGHKPVATRQAAAGSVRSSCEIAQDAGGSAPLSVTSPSAMDLATLRNIGGVDSGVSISPDGQYVAFEVHQAQPLANRYINQWMLLNVVTHDCRIIVADGGEVILTYGEYGKTQAGVGEADDYHDSFAVLTPVWVADSQSFYYARKESGRIGLHRAFVNGTDRAVETPSGDVIEMKWQGVNKAVLTIRAPSPATIAAAEQIEREGLLFTGDEFIPSYGIPNLGPKKVDVEYWLDLSTQAIEAVAVTGQPELAEGVTVKTSEYPHGVRLYGYVKSPDGSRFACFAFTKADEFAVFVSSTGLVGDVARVSSEFHDVPGSLTWSGDGRHLYFVETKGYTASNIYVSDVDTRNSQPVTQSSWFLSDCAFTAAGRPLASCALESMEQPAEIALIDLTTGRIDVATDLNPKYNALKKPQIEALSWTNRNGDQAFGTLTYPLNYEKGKRYPLIVTSYYVPGFERGSNGDEFPIPVLAAAGFFVFHSSDLPYMHYLSMDSSGLVAKYADFVRLYDSERVSAEELIDRLAKEGTVDPDRVGVCGLSGGSTFTSYTISHSHRFRAAIEEWIENDPIPQIQMGFSGTREGYRALGLGPDQLEGTWKQFSTALSAHNVTAAVLMNLADHESLWNFESYWALREEKRPVEMWVFPGEYHAKWQPAHRLTVYERNVDWFNYWLRDARDPNPSKKEQYARWDKLLALQSAAASQIAREQKSSPATRGDEGAQKN
jgi:hypothetical protein